MNNKYIVNAHTKKIDTNLVTYINRHIRATPYDKKISQIYSRHVILEQMDGLY